MSALRGFPPAPVCVRRISRRLGTFEGYPRHLCAFGGFPSGWPRSEDFFPGTSVRSEDFPGGYACSKYIPAPVCVRRISQRLAALRGFFFFPAPQCARRIFPADLRRLCASGAYGNDQSSAGSSALSRATLIPRYRNVSTYGGIHDTAGGESRSAAPCQSTVGASAGTHRRWRSRNSMRTVEEALTACFASLAHTHNGVIALEPAGAPSGGGSANQAAALSRGEYVAPAGNASADSSAGRFPNVHLTIAASELPSPLAARVN